MSIFKFEIETEDLVENRTLLTGTVKNGNWRAWESWQGEPEETPLTINTLQNFDTINCPVKLICKDYEVINGELEENGEHIRIYDSLIELLTIAIDWAKSSYLNEREYKIILLDCYMRMREITKESEVIFKNDYKAVLKMEKVE